MKKSVLTGTVILTLTAATLCSYGTTNYWDNNGSTAGFGTAGGIWGSEGKWSGDSNGISTPAVTNTTAFDDLFFGTATNGLATGIVTVDSTNQAFGTITFGADSGEITLSNGTLNLASPASSIIINNRSNIIDTVLAGTNGLQIYKEEGRLTYSSYLTKTPTTIFSNATLADYIYADGILGGDSITGGTIPATAFYFSNNGTTATYQLQAEDGTHIKCVKVELTQVGADIAARAIYAKYFTGATLGYNFDLGGGTDGTVATSQTTIGYGAAETELISTCTLTLTGQNTYSGNTTISNGVFRIGEAGQLGSGTYDGDIINSGTLLYNSTSNQVLSGNISGSGTLVMESPYKTSSLLTYTNFLKTTPTVIFPNTELEDCAGADGTLGGDAISDKLTPGTVCFFTNTGSIATWQLQTVKDTPWTKCVKIQLAQSGKDITGKVLYAKYTNTSSVIGFDFDTGGTSQNVATSTNTGAYGAAETTINIKSHSALTLSGTNSYLAGTVINSGRLLATSTANALPSSGGITVNNGGELKLNVTGMHVGNSDGVGNGNAITVNAGGVLNLANNFNAGYSRSITINGGSLTSTFFENNDGANYINNLTLQNGAQVTGYKIRVGYHSAVTINVTGTSPSSIPAGINMVKRGTDPLTFNVEDVTGDDNADLTIPGVIRDYPSLENMPIIKNGDGTVEFSAANTHIGIITIDAGTLSLAANNSLISGNNIVLSGGALDMGAYTNAVDTLTLDDDSDVVLGSGELAFADSSATSWSGTLTVTGVLSDHSIRFGTSDSSLTSAQLAAIILNGGSAQLSADGYLIAPPGGTLILVQ
ncbi:MAG: autotransporter-associated beta strand repeat-containing protein [Kiritimatiellae bacterium]|nr:autotransporter-associated beta strand repeat-containing protein [Kiritimatiellia bacterium]